MERPFHGSERPEGMQAILAVFDMDRALFAVQQRSLKERIVPFVKSQPGFVAGYWSYDHTTAKSYSFIVLESQEAATRFAEAVRAHNAQPNDAGVRLESITPVEVVAEAHR